MDYLLRVKSTTLYENRKETFSDLKKPYFLKILYARAEVGDLFVISLNGLKNFKTRLVSYFQSIPTQISPKTPRHILTGSYGD
jgi:hypothetical protein